MLPPDATLRDRTMWAALSVLVGKVHDGPELSTDQRVFERIEAASRTFGIQVDALARLFGFYYHRGSDCYVDREVWEQLTLTDAWHWPVVLH